MNKQEIVKSIENLERSIVSNKAHNKEHKKEIKELRVQLEELPKLEVGKWYKNPQYGSALYCVTSIDLCNDSYSAYGFNYSGQWRTNEEFGDLDSDPIPATDKEVEEALIKEAKKRGFKEGVTIEGRDYTVGGHIFTRIYCGDLYLFMGNEYGSNIEIMSKGKWSTIIKDKTVTLNGDYTKVQLTDVINNRFEV